MVGRRLIIWHEATVVELMMLFGHGSRDIIWERLSGVATLWLLLVICIASTLVHDSSIIWLMLLSSSDLIQNICVNVRGRVNLLGMRHLMLLRLCGARWYVHMFLLQFGSLNVRSLLIKVSNSYWYLPERIRHLPMASCFFVDLPFIFCLCAVS